MKATAVIAFIFAIVAGYGQDWSAYYVNLFDSQDSSLLGSTSNFKFECREPENVKSKCSYQYRIPLKKSTSDQWVGVGSIISATRFLCENGQEFQKYDDHLNPGNRFDLMTIYQRARIPPDCGNYISVQEWSRINAVRKGHLGGAAYIGSQSSINSVSAIYEFFTIELTRILAYVFMFVVLIQKLTENIYAKRLHLNPLSAYSFLWVLFLLCASNIVQVILPIQNNPLLMNKLTALLSAAAHSLGILTFWLSRSDPKIRSLVKFSIALLLGTYSIFVFTPWFPVAFISFFLISALASTLLGIRANDLSLSLYGITLSLVALKVANVPGLPSAMTTCLYVGVYLAIESIRQVKKLTILIGQITKATEEKSNELQSQLKNTEQSLFELLETRQLSFLYILPESKCEIRTYTRTGKVVEVQTLLKEEFPPLFAHVISQREAVWGASPDDKLIMSIKTKSSEIFKYEEKYFSIVPLFDSNNSYGGFAFTTDENSNNNSETSLSHKVIAELYSRQIIQSLNYERSAEEASSLKELNSLDSSLAASASDKHSSEVSIAKAAISAINALYGSQGFIAKLDQNSRQLQIISIQNYPKEIEDRYLNGKVYAHKENEHGPLAITVNHQKTVIIQDVRLYSGVLHEFTNYFFKTTKTNSCASVPIYNTSREDEVSVWGVAFFEATDTRYFSMSDKPSFERVSEILSKSISTALKNAELKDTQLALESFIPSDLINSYLKDSNISRVETGCLLMIDLKSSTRISNSFGKDYWLNSIENGLKQYIVSVAQKHNFDFKNFVWDAFYFTQTCSAPTEEHQNSLLGFASEIAPILDDFYHANFGSRFHEFMNESTAKARLCVSFGDISMGIIQSEKKQWSITGQEMANLTKLESLAKLHQKENPYTIIYTDSSFAFSVDGLYKKTSLIVPESGREIFAYEGSWLEIKSTSFLKKQGIKRAA